MTAAFEQLESEALKLDRDERIILGQELLVSAMTDEEGEDLRIVRERIKAIDSGEAVTVDGTKAIADIRTELMRHR